MMPDIEIYDTTLRDGTQGEGVTFSVADKLRIAERLDALPLVLVGRQRAHEMNLSDAMVSILGKLRPTVRRVLADMALPRYNAAQSRAPVNPCCGAC